MNPPPPTPTPPPPPPQEETSARKITVTIAQYLAVLGATIGTSFLIFNILSEKEGKLREEINKVADNLTALNTSIKQVEYEGREDAQTAINNFSKLQGRLEVVERATKVFVPPTLTITPPNAETNTKQVSP